ncbi:hypothetical protein ACP70R_029888 [Stipagrostis hirtigluma subsp. patula]
MESKVATNFNSCLDVQIIESFERMMAGSWVVVGASFPLTDWLLAPYAHLNLTSAQHAFNEKVADLRRVTVDAFAQHRGEAPGPSRRAQRLLCAAQHLRVPRGGDGPGPPLL